MFWCSISCEGCGELKCIVGIMTKEKYLKIFKSKFAPNESTIENSTS